MGNWDFIPSPPDKEEISLTFVDSGALIRTWSEYTYAASMDTPTDGWSFTITAGELPDGLLQHLLTAARVQLKLNNQIQGDGFVDSVEVRASRHGGKDYNIQGRDRIAQAVDACADPTHTFKEGMALLDVLVELFTPFGWTSPDDFIIDNEANTRAKAGIRATPRSKGGKKRGPQPLKGFLLHQLRPYPREGVFQFASRIAERHGLRIWQAATGTKLIVSQPNFDIEPFYQIRRNNEGTTNVLEGSVKFNVMNQPTCIVADAASGGGEFGRGRIKSIMANTLVHVSDPKDLAFMQPWAKYPDANRVLGQRFSNPVAVAKARTLYLHDEESTTQFQLDNFVRREMAKLQRESLTVSYTCEGHGQITDHGFVPWEVDTTVDVLDDVAGLHERMYVLARTFHKSRSGTTTKLDLIRLHTIELGEPPDPVDAPKPTPDAEIAKVRRQYDIEFQK